VFCNTEFGSLKFTPQETAIICELLLRGPQTPGELRSRIPRMAELPDPGVVEGLLDALASRPEGGLVAQLPREAGRRDSRWANLFEELPAINAAEAPLPATSRAVAGHAPAGDLAARVAALESQLAALRAELEALKTGGQA